MPSGTILLRYWAAARAAAGAESESVPVAAEGELVGPLLDAAAARHPELVRVLRVATVLVDGRAADRATRVAPAGIIEVLPPFAGG